MAEFSDSDTDSISDGYHTFGELYAHRAALFAALMHAFPERSWIAPQHSDGSVIPGFLIAGMDLPSGSITYHLRMDPWCRNLIRAGVPTHITAPQWDGHTPDDVLARLIEWIESA